MRYIKVPQSFEVVDPIEEKPTGDVVSFSKFVSTLCVFAAQKQGADALLLIDIRKAAKNLMDGDIWECPDEYHSVLTTEARKPSGLNPYALLSAESHIRAIVDAPTSK